MVVVSALLSHRTMLLDAWFDPRIPVPCATTEPDKIVIDKVVKATEVAASLVPLQKVKHPVCARTFTLLEATIGGQAAATSRPSSYCHGSFSEEARLRS